MATINGTSGDDTLYGTSGADTISGLGGNDVLVGFAGADHLDGGSGIDSVFYFDSSAGVGVNLETGKGTGGSAQGDTLVSIEHVWGSSHNDTLTGNAGANDLYGLDGNDILKGGGGADGLDGGSGDDILKGGGGADFLQGGSGNDTADYSLSPPTIPGGEYGVNVSLHSDHFPGHGVGGDAQYDTYSSIENLTGSAYHDSLTGDDNINVLRGLDGNDTLDGFGGHDILDGGNGDDRLTGGGGNDVLRGGPGADELNGGLSSDPTSYSDTADYSDKTVSVAVTLNTFNFVDVFVGGAAEDRIRNIENVTGGSGNDTLVGDLRANALNGGAGNDLLDGGTGADTLAGGTGNDVYYVDNAGDAVNELAGQGLDRVHARIDYTLGGDVEDLTLEGTALVGTGNARPNVIVGTTGANTLSGLGNSDVLYGNAGDDTLLGGAGHDDLFGGMGNDTLQGEEGNDRLYGEGGNDIIFGGAGDDNVFGGADNDNVNGGNGADTVNGQGGDDLIVGGQGIDLLVGGAGADRFLFNDGHLGGGLSATDRITDFSQVQGDSIDLHLMDADTTLGGNQAFTWIGGAAFSGTAGELRFAFAGNTTTIYGDTNGDGTADFALWLTGQIELQTGDFVL